MGMRLRIATFNDENLAARNSFGTVERPETAPALSVFDTALDRSIPYLSSRNDRYARVGWDGPKASDRCPVVVELGIPLRASSAAARGRS